VQRAVALEHVYDLVVEVVVVGRAPGRDVADELRRRRARHEQAEHPARRRFAGLDVVHADDGMPRAVRGQRIAHEHGQELQSVGLVDAPARACGDVHRGAGGQPGGLTADRCGRVAAQHVEHLVVGRGRFAAAGALEPEQALLELGASALGAEQHVLLVGLDAPAHRRPSVHLCQPSESG
jgi:hypothetical protein